MKAAKPWIVVDDDVRPARPDGTCFYCFQPLGTEHKPDCVIRNKTCVVDFTLRLVVTVPENFTPENIEFKFNHGGWCADNLLGLLDFYKSSTGHCLCNICKAKYVREATPEDEKDCKLYINAEQEARNES